MPGKLPLDRPVQVRARMGVGTGRDILTGIGDAIVALVSGLLLTLLGGPGSAILGVVFLGRPATGSGACGAAASAELRGEGRRGIPRCQ